MEQALVEGCLRQDRRSQRMLYERYKDAMYTLAYRITNDFDLAADVLQEAFLGVFNGLPQFQQRSTLGAWIRTIVVRTAYKKIRKEARHIPLEAHEEQEAIDWGTHLDVEYLEKAIQSLPAGYRSVFVLIEIEGYTHKEVAELLGISPGTSKSQLHYAKKLLRKRLNALEQQEMSNG
ncbi:MAG: RNA polymerase sigma factor [Bacteroidetes bacterium]|nr:MAG: RNA polymerase sigma factor [Bacteroidota bacterium]